LVGYKANRIALLDGTRVSIFGLSDGLDIGNVFQFMTMMGRSGLAASRASNYSSKGISPLSVGRSEPLRGVSGIVLAKNGDLWLNQASGVVHIAADEVRMCAKTPTIRRATNC